MSPTPTVPDASLADARRVMERCDELATYSAMPDGIELGGGLAGWQRELARGEPERRRIGDGALGIVLAGD